jgi:hypothetical protein
MDPGPPPAFYPLPPLSSGLAASLQVIDVSYCRLNSINALRSCVRLTCLRIPGVGVGDLSPLGACSELEELWIAWHSQVTSLAPLKACPRLCKLDLRGCRSTLQDQVADLQRVACTQLADPKTVEIEGVVLDLQPGMPLWVQQAAARELGSLDITNKAQAFPAHLQFWRLARDSAVRRGVLRLDEPVPFLQCC